MKYSVLLFMLSFHLLQGQNRIEWDGTYKLTLFDFQSTGTKIGDTDHYSLSPATNIDFSFAMSTAEFIFTKNFNSKVTCYINRSAALLVAPDSAYAKSLLNFAQYEFDLCELYARKFRKRLYEDKGAFSNINFFKPIYDQNQKEYIEQYTQDGNACDFGQHDEKLKALHQHVLHEIDALANFCKTCKPPKKRK